ncbi:MAG: Hsp70 family protein [Methylococcales bacterium]
MNRSTVDFGIDLGTTNSATAVSNGGNVEVIKNNDNLDCTSSAVWVDKNNKEFVGLTAKNQLEVDPDNAFSEFKLQMGNAAQRYRFARSGSERRPEDLSAAVLKSLKKDVRQRLGEEIECAVICVPAAFELPQCSATKQAAQLAGLTHSPLVQEPVAAALAYGFQSQSDKVFWLVYDLGGGTFDAAVVQVREGTIQVVNHGGDNHLGGKLIDWAIVDELLIPSLTKQKKLREFHRGNPKWRAAIAKLKQEAERAKIRLSHNESVSINLDFLCLDDSNQPVQFEYDLRVQDVERVAEPFILNSINICRRVLQEKRLGPLISKRFCWSADRPWRLIYAPAWRIPRKAWEFRWILVSTPSPSWRAAPRFLQWPNRCRRPAQRKP